VIALVAGAAEAKAVLDAWLARGSLGFLTTVPQAHLLPHAVGGE